MKDFFIRDLFFRKGWFDFIKDSLILVLVLFWPDGLNKSFIYKGQELKVVELIHCYKRSFIGNQLLLKSFEYTWGLLLNFR